MFKNPVKLIAAVLVSLCGVGHSAIVTTVNVNYDAEFNSFDLLNQTGVPLSAGAVDMDGYSTVNGDGFAVQLGYFTGGSAASNFAGSFVVLAGFGTLNTQYPVYTMGDGGGLAGSLFGSFRFEPGVAQRGSSLPADNTFTLALRFYNAPSVAAATFYNTVSNDAWLWKVPAAEAPIGPIVNMGTSGTLEFEAPGAGNNFRTVIPVPEPTSAFLVAIGAAGLMMRRRRQS